MDEPKSFDELGLGPEITAVLKELGYEAPTPIQERTIPPMLAGRDVIGQAQTGTGKTAAFALPIIQRIDRDVHTTQALVLAPTRELAMQVAEAIHSYCRGTLTVLPVYGGAPIVHQLKRLERGAQIVVGTPGRIIDHLDRKSLALGGIRTLVLDEADEMLRMGFIDDVERILSEAPPERQIALFSATMPEPIVRIANRHLKDAEHVEAPHHTVTAPAIEQRFINLSEGQKLEVLTQILELESSEATLVFRRTKTGSAELADRLHARGFAVEAMHGDMTQQMRESVVRKLRAGQLEVVVATDVAARGLDVEQIEHVVNFDIPYDVEAYVHRIGRTGRAGRSGIATLFITPRERRMMREIERYTGTTIKPMKVPTSADVAAKRAERMKETVRKALEEGDLEMYLQMVEQIAEEGSHDMAEIAAASLRLASGARPVAVGEEKQREEAPMPPSHMEETRERAVRAFGREPATSRERPVRERPAPRERKSDSGEPIVTLSIQVGKRDGVRPADVVGSIANEADVPGRDIGPIDIRDSVTYVGVPESVSAHVIEKLGKARFRGRAVNVQLAKEVPSQRSPREEFNREGPRRDAAAKRPYQRPGAGERPQRREAGSFGRPRTAASDDRPPRRESGSFPRPRTTSSDDRPPRRDAGSYSRARTSTDDRPPRRETGSYAKPRAGSAERPPSRGAYERPRAVGRPVGRERSEERSSFARAPRRDYDSPRPPARAGAATRTRTTDDRAPKRAAPAREGFYKSVSKGRKPVKPGGKRGR